MPAAPPAIRHLPPVITPERRPGVVTFYRVWCCLFVVLYLGFCTTEILVARGSVEPSMGLLEEFLSHHDKELRGQLIAEKRAEAPGFAAFVCCIALGYGAAAASPRKPRAWVLGIVVLASTIFPFVITAAGAVPALVYWGRPEVKCHFGKR